MASPWVGTVPSCVGRCVPYGVAVADEDGDAKGLGVPTLLGVVLAIGDGATLDDAAVVTVRAAHGEATGVAVIAGLAVGPLVGVSAAPDAGVAVAVSAPVGLTVPVGQAPIAPVPGASVGVAPVVGGVAGVAARAVAVLKTALTGVEAIIVWTGGTAVPEPAPQAVAVITARPRTPPTHS